ncbi:FecR family protein [Flavilitoribacter nigricans]|uniref:Uncharacterized protein n=1 Tax=Flavilitoribacter nigricans (strain ATCC 23147 / DSM 23189 / NBRC 102662 / NCIMB 1420 / SS-2) TaxID=1122177 RepID=A0A2D0NGS4_FLAN2|nr:FecR domain-containing protein [Flavilitoribacter nigricans]PHN07687.1 hypothetical protein CRP01_06195 [Flavilitoribacter nigricans DSM 23189 = NBRC 102662]
MNLNQEQLDLLEKWLDDPSFHNWAKQTNDTDIAHWEHFFNLHPRLQALGETGRSLVIGVPFQKVPVDESEDRAALDQLLQRLEQKGGSGRTNREARLRKLRPGRRWIAVASIILVLTIGWGIYRSEFANKPIQLSTDYGEQYQTQLPDGSLVHLNANSRLTYYPDKPRKVWLEGEAFFEVQKKAATGATFQVITEDLAVTVHGTAFNVNARNDQTKVFLEEGKVSLQVADPERSRIDMQPGDLVSYSKKQNNLLENQKDVSALESVSWKDGTLIFKETPLSEALPEIEEIYGIEFVVLEEKLLDETIGGGVPIRDLQVTLQTLRDVYGLRIEADGNRYLISGVE